MNQQTNVRAAQNLRIWEELSRTDPRHTKQFKRAGGFSGTALKPIWIVKRLTEQFGPVGEGWGIGEPTFQIVPGFNNEMLVYCTVQCWHGQPSNSFYGVGGDKVVTHIKANEQYKRPERWENDDEAFKKAFTDAVNNAFKFVGVGADIHMGQFEDNKYVQETVREFEEADREAAEEAPVKVPGISAIKKKLNKLMLDGNASTELDAFNTLVRECADELQKIKEANHDYWTGDGGDEHEGFKKWIVRRRAELSAPRESDELRILLGEIEQCDTNNALQAIINLHGDEIDALDDLERDRFEKAFERRESIVRQVSVVSA